MSMEQLVRTMMAQLFARPEQFYKDDSKFYMWGPGHPPLVGPAEMKRGFADLAARLTDVSIDYLDFAGQGDVVFVERIDHFTVDHRHKIDLPIIGKGKLGDDGKFLYWQDFFDLSILTKINLHPDGAGIRRL
jgi:limonene-1,2-epoxide hydrolase